MANTSKSGKRKNCDISEFGRWLAYRIDSRDPYMTQKELAEKSGGSETHISGFLRGVRNPKSGTFKKPSDETAIALAEALNTDPAKLPDDIDQALLAAGFAPKRLGSLEWRLDGSCAFIRADVPMQSSASTKNTDEIRDLLKNLDAKIERLTQEVANLRKRPVKIFMAELQ